MKFNELIKIPAGLTVRDWLLWGGLLAFRVALDVSYQYFLYPLYESDSPISFRYAVEVDRYLFSFLIFTLFVTVLRSRAKTVSDVFLFMATLFLVAPMTSEYGLNAARPLAPVMTAVIALLLVDLVARIRLLDVISTHPVPGGRMLVIVLSVIAILYLVAWGYFSGAFQYFSFDVRRVYEFRDKVTELLDVGVLGYFNLWTYKVFTIFLVCVLLQYRRFGLLLLVLACQIYFFGLTSHRIVLFLPLLAIGLWLYLGRLDQLAPMPYVTADGLLFALYLHQAWSIDSIPEIAIRRAFFVPSGLVFQWFDYFDAHPHIYWADKILASFSDGVYVRVNIPRLIGDYLVPGSNSAANSGMVAAGYAQAGYLGVTLYAIILGLVLSVLNGIVRSGVPLWLVAALSIGPLRTAVADSDLFTALLSHGLGLAVLLLWLYRDAGTEGLGTNVPS
jgi:hypothetical protein